MWKLLAAGAIAGLTGTLVLQSLRTAKQKWMPKAEAPIKADPGKFIVQQAEKVLPEKAQPDLSEAAEEKLGNALGLGYGVSFGLLYAALGPWVDDILCDGLLLGLGTWAAGYLGWLPASGLMSPVWKQEPKQILGPLAEHAVYGVATAAAFRWLDDKSARTA